MADGAAKFIANASPGLPESLHRAQAAHSFHHLNAHTLRLTFDNSRERARQGVKQCPSCETHLPTPHLGVNPKGLVPNTIWQMDATHCSEFGNLQYIHVCTDTYSGFIVATLRTGEASKQVSAHYYIAFLSWGFPNKLKLITVQVISQRLFKNFVHSYTSHILQGFPVPLKDKAW